MIQAGHYQLRCNKTTHDIGIDKLYYNQNVIDHPLFEHHKTNCAPCYTHWKEVIDKRDIRSRSGPAECNT